MSISLDKLIEAGAHFGHQAKYWNPKMKPFIFGVRNKIHIINLDKTVTMFDDALKFIKQTVKNKGTILFVGTRPQAREIIAEEAKRVGMPYVDYRWLGGMLTNFETVKKSIKKLETKSVLLEKSGDNGLSKKEILDLKRDIEKLQSSIGGIVQMKSIPSAIFVIDTGCHDIAIKEAKKLGIPVIGIVDTNNDPQEIDYVIPGNDDSSKAIKLYLTAVADSIALAKESIVEELVSHVKMELVEKNGMVEPKKKTIRRVKKSEAVENESEDESTESNVELNISEDTTEDKE